MANVWSNVWFVVALLTTVAQVNAQSYTPRSFARENPVIGLSKHLPAPRQPSAQLVRLPPVGPEKSRETLPAAASASRGTDGTWREEGQFIIINLNGQQYRLVKSDSRGENRPAKQTQPTGGEVLGRLTHQGKPLVRCQVTLAPLRKTWTGFTIANSAEAEFPTTATDGSGVYRFTNVPAGPYKLKWRPADQSSWIRRAEFRPDVRVRANETSRVKEIRVALRTIN